jgi:ASPIC/UnbV protein/VCBS repeat protein
VKVGPPNRVAIALVAAAILAATCTSEPGGGPSVGPTRGTGPSALRFSDVAQQVGLDFQHGAFRWDVTPDVAAMMGGGVCWLDYDADGWLDLFVVNSYAETEASRWRDEGGLPHSALFHNLEGRFEDVSAGSGADLAARGTGCVAADFDLDGSTDLYVTSAGVGALLWNEGDGTFTEGAGPAGVNASGWYAGGAVGDVNRDGWPDLFLAGYADVNTDLPDASLGFPNTKLGVRDLLFLSDGPTEGGHVTFREVGADAGLEVVGFEYGLGAVLSDLDRDDDLDLFVANDTKPDRLYENVPWPGGADADPAGLGFRFEELAARAGVADPAAGMGVAEGDYDGDGRPDLFVTNARGQVHGVFRGQDSELVKPSFADVRQELGPDLGSSTGWGVSWADFDLDTDLDLLFANGNIPVTDLVTDAEPLQMLENLTSQGTMGVFEDASGEVGLGVVGSLDARGSAVADYDNDGDLDVAINSIGGQLVLLENSGVTGNWLEVELNGFAPGAVVTVVLADGRRLVREVHTGSSYLSSEDPRCHFGLGTISTVNELIVHWPSGEETRLPDVDANRLIEVRPP